MNHLHLHPRDPTVSIQAAVDVLTYLENASGAATFLDCGDLLTNPFVLIERCRAAVAEMMGVEIDSYLVDQADED